MIHPDSIQWRLKGSYNLKDQHYTVLRDDELKVQCEKIANKLIGEGVGKTKSAFYIDGDEREFHTVEEMVDAYNEKFKFEEENPELEVRYIRVITKRKKDEQI